MKISTLHLTDFKCNFDPNVNYILEQISKWFNYINVVDMPYYSLERYSGCKKFEFAQVVKYNITTLKELEIF